jgi:predicted NAD/FAD-binding protein
MKLASSPWAATSPSIGTGIAGLSCAWLLSQRHA